MKALLISCLALGLGGCIQPAPRPGFGISVSSGSYLRPPQPNTAPRGSREFCRIYGQQTAENRMRASTGFNGRGPSGADIPAAEREGERAAERCASGKLN